MRYTESLKCSLTHYFFLSSKDNTSTKESDT